VGRAGTCRWDDLTALPCLATGTASSCPSDRHCIGLAAVRTAADPTAIAFPRPNIHPAATPRIDKFQEKKREGGRPKA